jgi:basic membrane protein A and related proteins
LKTRAVTNTLAAILAVAAFGATAPAWAFLACAVTDVGGVDDKGFNASAWQGTQDGAKAAGGEAKLLQSKSEADYVPNLTSLLQAKCDIITTVGFLLGDATKASAEANPNQKFTIIDYAYDPTIPNVLGQLYSTNQGGFVAGYLAASVSKTGVVGTFGGINVGPAVTDYMDGFVWGVDYYNKAKGKSVKVLGWDPVKKEGLFTGNFDSLDDGRTFAKNLNDEGADIVMPVAGKVGQGSAALAQELGPDALKIIGVDTDQYVSDPDHKSVFLTSALKNIAVTQAAAVKSAADGTFKGGVAIGDFANNGVGIAPYHDLDAAVPADLKAEIDKLVAGIKDGSIKVGG